VLPEKRLIIEGVECHTIRELKEIQLRFLRNYLINMGSQERVCFDYLRAYSALDRGLDFRFCDGRDPMVAGKYDSPQNTP